MKDLISPPIAQKDLDNLNLNLLVFFGTEEGKPRYIVVWANDEFEIRKGKRNIFYNDTFLREEVGVWRSHKYPMYKNRYVLERILFYVDPAGELLDTEKGSYEAVYCYQTTEDKYLHPNWKITEIICKQLEAPKIKKTESDFLEEDRKKLEKEVEDFKEYLDDKGPSPLFYPGETGKQGVFIDSIKSKLVKFKG